MRPTKISATWSGACKSMTGHIENTHEFVLPALDGTALFVRDWPLPAGSPAHDGVVIMHGLGEHCGRYAHVARFFNALGFAVRTYDHRGHGKSGGARGDVPDQDAMLRDARMVINDFSKQLDASPLLFGHSMGGWVAAKTIARDPKLLGAALIGDGAYSLRPTPFRLTAR